MKACSYFKKSGKLSGFLWSRKHSEENRELTIQSIEIE